MRLVGRQQVGHEEDLRFRNQGAGETRRLIDEFEDTGLGLLHDVGRLAQGTEGEELHGVIGVGFDLFLELGGEDALDLVDRLLEGVLPVGRLGGGRQQCA